MAIATTTRRDSINAESFTAAATQPLCVSYLRFSTAEQAKGDSVRRQVERSETWAAARGWKIDDQLRDPGVSAYHGANATTGALARIVSKIDDKTIPAGSYLVLESLDRLSRTELLEAIELLMSVIRRGVNVVSLYDNREYRKDTFNLTDLGVTHYPTS